MHIYEVRPRRDKRGFDIVVQNKIEFSETELPKSGPGKTLKRLLRDAAWAAKNEPSPEILICIMSTLERFEFRSDRETFGRCREVPCACFVLAML